MHSLVYGDSVHLVTYKSIKIGYFIFVNEEFEVSYVMHNKHDCHFKYMK